MPSLFLSYSALQMTSGALLPPGGSLCNHMMGPWWITLTSHHWPVTVYNRVPSTGCPHPYSRVPCVKQGAKQVKQGSLFEPEPPGAAGGVALPHTFPPHTAPSRWPRTAPRLSRGRTDARRSGSPAHGSSARSHAPRELERKRSREEEEQGGRTSVINDSLWSVRPWAGPRYDLVVVLLCMQYYREYIGIIIRRHHQSANGIL